MYKFIFFILFCCIVQALSAQTAALDLQRKGDGMYRRDSFFEAAQAYSRATKENGQTSVPMYNQGNALYQSKQTKQAKEAYIKAALGTNATSDVQARAWYNIGNIEMDSQKYQEAINAYEQSLRLQPGQAVTKNNLQLAKRMLAQQSPPPPPEKQDKKQPPQPSQEKQPQDQPQQPDPTAQSLDRDAAGRALDLLEKEEQKVKRNVRKEGPQAGQETKKRW
jgi:Ca-activated chloride channel homolog